jgi:hypothetical protein
MASSTYSKAKVITIKAAVAALCYFGFSCLLGVPSAMQPAKGHWLYEHLAEITILQFIVWSIWTVGIPIWFWIEFHWIGTTIENAERQKYSQELSSKVWLACTAVLSALYFGKYFIK